MSGNLSLSQTRSLNSNSLKMEVIFFTILLAISRVIGCALESQESPVIADGNDLMSLAATNSSVSGIWRLIPRTEWLARPPQSVNNFTGLIPFVIVHHSFNPGVCRSEDACKASMRSMQNYHMDGHGWPDIGYSFAVGGDGNVYEGRGYHVVGAHAPPFNSRSIGLLLIGNFQDRLPPAPMIQVAQEFIDYSIQLGVLDPNYTLYGHRQVRNTECPGDTLYNEIKTWPHWSELHKS